MATYLNPNTADHLGGRTAITYNALGDFLLEVNTNPTGNRGPRNTVPSHTWAEAEMMPERLIDPAATLADMSTPANIERDRTSTYRVVRAAAEQENMGNFDCVNCYDSALVSLGPCHWTMGISASATQFTLGELAGFLSYFQHQHADEYTRAFGRFGLSPKTPWAQRMTGMWNAGLRKYEGWYRHERIENPGDAAPGRCDIWREKKEAYYYKNWHWFFRWAMAGRVFAGYRQDMWDMVRIRIQDILTSTIRVTCTVPAAGIYLARNININATLGDFFTSEVAVAILLRWHIYHPANVVPGVTVRNCIRNAMIQNPNHDWATMANWADPEELVLTDRLYRAAFAVNETMRHLPLWPRYDYNVPPANNLVDGRPGRRYQLGNELGSLRTGRNTFHLDNNGI